MERLFDKKENNYPDTIEARKSAYSKFGSSATSFYTEKGSDLTYGEDPVEKHKKRTLKKVITSIPSLDKDVKNALILHLHRGPVKNLEEMKGKQLEQAEDLKEKLLSEGKKLLDGESTNELNGLLHKMIIERDSSYDTIMEILKLYLISATEKSFVEQIHEELNIGIALDQEIKLVTQQVSHEKEKKKNTKPVAENVEMQLRLIQQYENKIEKANQKLNEKTAKNNETRQRIDEVRKENLIYEQTRQELENELQIKEEKVEKTIQNAGIAYVKRNEAEKEIKELKQKAIHSKYEFANEMEKIKGDLQEVETFKEFISGKTKEKKELDILVESIAKNKKKIEEKEHANAIMEKDYEISAKKEEQIKDAFTKLMDETGSKKLEDLLIVYNTLYEKNQTIERYVKELNNEIEELNNKINTTKNLSAKGTTKNVKKKDEKTNIIKKLEHEDKKKRQYRSYYKELIETTNELKNMVQRVFTAIGVDQQTLDKVKNSAITEDNMIEFIGTLEQKGIALVEEYSYLLAEQIKAERGDAAKNPNLVEDLHNLNNIVAYENANVLLMKNSSPTQAKDFPDEMLTQETPNDREFLNNKETVLSPEQFQQLALSIIQVKAPTKKQALSPLPRAGHKKPRLSKLSSSIRSNKK